MNARRFRTAGILVAAGLTFGALAMSAGAQPAQAAIPSMTRAEIIARAESGLGAIYGWGRESWVPNAGGGTGPDCSGFTLKCWETPRTLLYQEDGEVRQTQYPLLQKKEAARQIMEQIGRLAAARSQG